METKGKFIKMTVDNFRDWLNRSKFTRKIKIIQNHHTYIPSYSNFKGQNHIALCENMERSHIKRGFSEIAQNITSFPDGEVVICRNINTAPAGIKGANEFAICIENLGNFDVGGDTMTEQQRKCIIKLNAVLLEFFKLPCDTDHVVYHHWWDLNSGKRTNGQGITKSCPGTAFFGGNSLSNAAENFIPLIKSAMA